MPSRLRATIRLTHRLAVRPRGAWHLLPGGYRRTVQPTKLVPKLRVRVLSVTRSRDHQLPNKALVGQGAAYRPRNRPGYGLRADTSGAPSSAVAGADLPVSRTNHRRQLAGVSALRSPDRPRLPGRVKAAFGVAGDGTSRQP